MPCESSDSVLAGSTTPFTLTVGIRDNMSKTSLRLLFRQSVTLLRCRPAGTKIVTIFMLKCESDLERIAHDTELLTSCVLVVVTMADPCLREQALADVAANFGPPFCEVALDSEMTTDHHVQVAVAPLEFLFLQSQRHTFDILFSADSERPKLLEEEGSGTTYVAGHLALCSSTSDHINEERPLSSKEFRCRREIAPSCALRSSLQEPVQ